MQIQLVPSSFPIKGKPRHDTVSCYAPNAFMFGPGKLAVSALRLSRNRWRVFNVANPCSWWGYGRRRYNVPRIGRHLRWLTSYGCYGCSYNYLRETWIAATTAHLEWHDLGPD